MSNEIPRGVEFPSSRSEAQSVGPYPVFDQWRRHNFDEKFPGLADNSHGDLLGLYYHARRRIQVAARNGRQDFEEMEKFNKAVQERCPNFKETHKEALKYILEQTQDPSSSKNIRRR